MESYASQGQYRVSGLTEQMGELGVIACLKDIEWTIESVPFLSKTQIIVRSKNPPPVSKLALEDIAVGFNWYQVLFSHRGYVFWYSFSQNFGYIIGI